MAVRTVDYFKDKFVEGYILTEEDIHDWLDSFRHVSAPVSLSDTEGLDVILSEYRRNDENVDVEEVEGLDEKISDRLADYLNTSSSIPVEQVEGLSDALAAKATLGQVEELIESIDFGEDGEDGEDGVSITSVAITEGHLIVTLSNDTEIDAGALPNGDFGRIVSRYQGQFSGTQNGSNTIFTMPENFVPGTVKVFKDGIRLSGGGGLDYEEEGTNKVVLTEPPTSENMLIFEYIRA